MSIKREEVQEVVKSYKEPLGLSRVPLLSLTGSSW